MKNLRERVKALSTRFLPGPPIRYLVFGPVPDDYVGTVYLHERSGGPKVFLEVWNNEPPEDRPALAEAQYPTDFDLKKDEANAE